METTGKKTRPAGATLHPYPKDTDPVYSGGWTILSGPNLNAALAKPSPAPGSDTEKPQPPKRHPHQYPWVG